MAVGIHSYCRRLTQLKHAPETAVKRLLAKKLKAKLLKTLERIANRIHPKNASGNNVSKM